MKQNNFLRSLFFNINPFLRYIFLFAFLFLILFAWFFLIFLNFKEKQSNLIAQIYSLQKKEQLLNNIKNEIKNHHFDIQIANDNFDKIVYSFPEENYENDYDVLMQNAKLAGVQVTICNSESKQDKGFYQKDSINFCFNGSFEQIFNFFKLLSESKAWVKFQKLKFTNNQNEDIKVEGIYKFYKPKKGLRWPR